LANEKTIDYFLDIVQKYQVFFVDIWGVLIAGGNHLLPSSFKIIEMLREKDIYLISNTTYTITRVEKILAGLNITPDLYQSIVTAGSLLNSLLERNNASGHYFYIGEEDTLDIVSDIYQRTWNINDAEFLIINGVSEVDVDKIFDIALKHKLPAFCPNPDISIQDMHGGVHFCAGFVANIYEKKGGQVFYIGKPYPCIYNTVLQLIKVSTPRNKILAIGDSLNTDILGANMADIDSLLVNSDYIHSESHIHPTYYIKCLSQR